MNITKIAELAGVSRATVSRYLNNGYVSQDKRERIQKVIDKTGYVPSSQAQTLRTKKTKLIGVIVPKISAEPVSRMVEGLSAELSREGYNLLLGNTGLSLEKELAFLSTFSSNQVDGIIMIGTAFTKKHLERMERLSVPLVVLGQRVEGYSCVYHDDEGAARALTARLLAGGCRRIGYLGVADEDRAAGLGRKRGYLSALSEAGIPLDTGLMCTGEGSDRAGYESASKLLKSKPDGLFCATDAVAAGALELLREQGLRVPQDVQVTGVGGSGLARFLSPKLTSAHYCYKTSGEEAARMLLEALGRPQLVVKELMLGFEIHQRESTLK